MIRLDGSNIDSHKHDRLIADIVRGVIADVRNFIEPRGELPDATPQLLVLKLANTGSM